MFMLYLSFLCTLLTLKRIVLNIQICFAFISVVNICVLHVRLWCCCRRRRHCLMASGVSAAAAAAAASAASPSYLGFPYTDASCCLPLPTSE